ncbi:MAG: S1 RNA-binding domain-containing protein, partial [Aestuariivirga sp.]
MGSKMLIDATHAEETRVVVVRGTRIEEFDFESAARRQLKGNIYLAKVTRVEPSLQAAFVEYGGNRHGFLAFSEIHPDYYQIPVADRQALLREQEEDDAAHREDDDNGQEDARPTRSEPLASEPEPSISDNIAPAEETESDAPDEPGQRIQDVGEDAESQKIDSIGAEDALEEVPQRQRRTPRRHYKIQEVIKRR